MSSKLLYFVLKMLFSNFLWGGGGRFKDYTYYISSRAFVEQMAIGRVKKLIPPIKNLDTQFLPIAMTLIRHK